MSLEEERARQAAVTASSSAPALSSVTESTSVESVLASGAFSTPVKKEETTESTPLLQDDGMNDDEDDDLARALAMSRGDVEMGEAGEEEDDEEAEIARAIAMSMKEDEEEPKKE
jgi:26S proteasome regulatory subunit N10